MNNEVQFDKSFKKFLVYLSLSAFIGLFGRFSVQSYLNKVWEPLQEQAEKEGVVVGQPKLQLSRFGLPVIGATLTEALYTKKINCYILDAKINDVFVPFPWELFYKNDWSFSGVKLGMVDLEISESATDCNSTKDVESNFSQADGVSRSSDESLLESVNKPAKKQAWLRLINKWFLNHKKMSEKNLISSMEIENLKIHFSNLKDKHIVASGNSSVSFDDSVEAKLKFDSLEFRKKERQILSAFSGELNAGDQEVKINGQWTFSEGKFKTDIRVNRDGETDVVLASKNIPLGVLNRWIDTPWSFQFLWLNCEMNTHAEDGAWQISQWNIKSCQISSPHGRVALLNKTLTSLKRPEAVEVEVKDLNLDQILKNKDQLPLAGVFKNFGILNGAITLNNRKWQSELAVQGAAIVFSKINLRKLQTVKQIIISGEYQRGNYDINLQDVSIEDGDFQGNISMKYNAYKQNGSGEVKVQKLLFSPEVQKLMLSGEISPITVLGKYQLGEDFRLKSWGGKLAFESYVSEGVSLSQFKADTIWADNGSGLGIQAQIAQVQALKNSSLQWMFATLLEEEKAALNLSQIKGEAVLKERVLEWQKLTGEASNVRFESIGSYGDNYVLKGTWTWYKNQQKLPWSFHYSNNEYFWLPQEDWLKKWLQSREDFLKNYDFVRLEKPKI